MPSARLRALGSIVPALLLAFVAPCAIAQEPESDDRIFPFESKIHDFDNGLRLITVPTEFPGTVAIHCVVSVGSRNEVEAGKSGFAHFFEHMMFRGTESMSAAEQAAEFKSAGADRNAYTTDDYTNYHTVVPTEELERVLRLEADRFQNLSYEETAFRTEALAVLGEYNKNSANPISQLFERIRKKAFSTHTYEHTTIGFLKDIRVMPGAYKYSLQFFDRYYRPEYTTIVVVGDVTAKRTQELVQKYWGSWERGGFTAEIPEEPTQTEPLEVRIPWPAPTNPWVTVAFKGPKFSQTESHMAALDLLSQLAFGDNSTLFKRLYLEERLVDQFFPYFPDQSDPGLVYVMARVRDPKDWATVRDAILVECRRLRTELVDAEALELVKTNGRYSFAGGLNSSAAIADTIAGYVARTRTPESINDLYRMYAGLKPEDLREAAQKTFVDSGRTIATVSHGELPEAPAPITLSKWEKLETTPGADVTIGSTSVAASPTTWVRNGTQVILQPSASPLVTISLAFETGAAHDPVGRKGLTYLAAQLLTGGATTERSYDQILSDLYPMATSVGASVGEELTVIGGTVHKDHLDAYTDLLCEMLGSNAFSESDFDRIRSDAITSIEIGLRDSDDEELGKEVLLQQIFDDHPYAPLQQGSVRDLNAIALADVRAHARSHLLGSPVVIGLAGGYPEGFADAFVQRLRTFAPKAGNATPDFGKRLSETASAPATLDESQMLIVEKNALATGMHFGFPIEVDRSHPDWHAMWLVRSYIGEHRSENSHLYQRLRELRGLNYGDYAYIEYFPNGGSRTQPPANHPRRFPTFTVWLRPVPHENAAFALKGAWFELNKLIENGLSQEEFEVTRSFLSKYSALLLQTADRRLGYTIDQRFYGQSDFVSFVRAGLERLTLEDVNQAIRRHLHADRIQYVVVTDDGERFKQQITALEATPITYATKPDQATLDEDEIIEAIHLDLRSENVRVVPVAEVFER
ncbi:MAG: pitrilysin family protein [Planctomycetota bacterium]